MSSRGAPGASVTGIVQLLSNSEPCDYEYHYVQEKLVYTFQQGLISQQAKLCVTSLTVCMLEIQQTMGRLMATILMKLSQATASPLMAVPVLEFLHGATVLCVRNDVFMSSCLAPPTSRLVLSHSSL